MANSRPSRRRARLASNGDGLTVETAGNPVHAERVINCAGLQSDRVARLCGLEPEVRIIPFRGLYYLLTAESRDLVRALIYPVPDPRLPFLGVHLTRTIDDKVKAGPNAVLALSRDGYRLARVFRCATPVPCLPIRDSGGWPQNGGRQV